MPSKTMFFNISSFSDYLISHHNLGQINKLVISDRMLFANLSYVFYNNETSLMINNIPYRETSIPNNFNGITAFELNS